MVNKLKRIVIYLEKSRISFHGFLITFLGTIFLRNFLETFSDRDNFWTPVSFFAYFVHYPMFYLCLFMALVIILHWLTREKIVKITKILLFFFPIVLIAPILDLLLSGGQGYNMSYLFGDLSYLIRNFITFPWNYSGRGATPGIQIELMVIFLLVICYLILKTGKPFRAVIGGIFFYVLVFVSGSIPSFITIFWNLKGPITDAEGMFGGEVVLYHFYSFNHKMALVFFPLLLGELSLWFWLYDRRKFLALLRNLRGLRVFHYLSMLGFGMFLGYAQMRPVALFDSPFPLLILSASASSVALAWWFAAGVNDLYDIETDKITNTSRPLVSGIISTEEQQAFNMVLLLLSLIAGYLVRYPFFLTILLCIALSYIYSASPFRAKRIIFLATFILACCAALVCLAGFVLFSDDYSFYNFPPRILYAILVTFTIAFTVKDIKDIKGDRITGTITLPLLLGEKKGKVVIGLLAVLAYVSVPVILGSVGLTPFALIFAIPTYFLINQKHMREAPIFALYFLFLGVILYFIYPQIHGM
jgi:4-hydroxybenzoate polyprenyltransferase